MPGRESTITVIINDADGAFHAAVQFTDGNENEVTSRDNKNSSDYAGDDSTDVLVTMPVASSYSR
jgi:hypothetical protein